MYGCVFHKEDGFCEKFSDDRCKSYCVMGPCKYAIPSHADKVRTMSDEELAEFLWNRDIQIVERASKAVGFNYNYDEAQCTQNILDWLKSPVEEEQK